MRDEKEELVDAIENLKHEVIRFVEKPVIKVLDIILKLLRKAKII